MSLAKLRKDIDKVDAQIIFLLNQRYELVKQVGNWKHLNNSFFYIPEREKLLLERLQKINQGLLPDKVLRAIYREVLSGALYLEENLKIAFLGPENTFSHQAAKNKFGECLTYIPQISIAGVFDAVSSKEVQYGVVPVENSLEGAVNYTLDLLADADCKICAELNIHPEHCFISKGNIEEIKTIYSHPQAFGQCRKWLYRHYPNIELVEVKSTAEASKYANKDSSNSAIASELSANLLGLRVHQKSIEDDRTSMTRFLVLANQETKPSGYDKTSIVFSIDDKIGALKDSLECFSENGINLTMIESRPCRKNKNQHLFFSDFLGHEVDKKVQEVLQKLKEKTLFLKVLGSYPQA